MPPTMLPILRGIWPAPICVKPFFHKNFSRSGWPNAVESVARMYYNAWYLNSPITITPKVAAMSLDDLRTNDCITVLKWPEKEELRGRVTSVLKGTPAGWEGVYYEVLEGAYLGHRLFAMKPQILNSTRPTVT